MAQTWHDLLFAHWPIRSEIMRLLVPPALTLDTFDGCCWAGIVPFHMSGVRARGLPAFPGLSRFPELNVRTYVTLDDNPGVYFFSLDAANLAAVWTARALYRLPYFHAQMNTAQDADSIAYVSQRLENPAAEIRGRYRPVGPIQLRPRGTLENWLTERYCLYTVWGGRVYRGEIHHAQWPLQDAEAEIEKNTMASAAGIALPNTAPLLHFAKKLDVLIWPLGKVR